MLIIYAIGPPDLRASRKPAWQYTYNACILKNTVDDLEFDWDAANIEHIARHEVRPEEAREALMNDPVETDYDVAEDEERWTSIGHTNKLRILKLVWTLRGERVRVVTAVEATKGEAREYLRVKGFR
jgi:uncharacterized DUF497 family protein